MKYFFHLEDGACIRDPKGENASMRSGEAQCGRRARPSSHQSTPAENAPEAHACALTQEAFET
jgi:hypothetical protein